MSEQLELQAAPPAEPAEEAPLSAARSVPWVAVAFCAHVLAVVIAWFVIPVGAALAQIHVISAKVDALPLPPEPEMKPPQINEFPEVQPQETEVVQPQLVVDPKDESNQDPTDQPNRSLAQNPDSDSLVESPHPNKNNNSSEGLGGGPGGGRGAGGDGGLEFRRGPKGGPSGNRERVDQALLWLADHQNIEGHWSATNFHEDSKRKNAKHTYNLEFVRPGQPEGDKGWGRQVDVGLTGLALLCFTASGCDHKTGGGTNDTRHFNEVCRRAIQYLRRVQGTDGCFGGKEDHEYVYNHAICTMAVCEAFNLSNDNLLYPICERAVKYIMQIQNPGLGWRYGEKPGDNDSSVTGWMVLALKTAKSANIAFDIGPAYHGAGQWLDGVTSDFNGYPRTGYNEPGTLCSRLRVADGVYDHNASMDAINIMTRLFMGADGWDIKNRVVQSQASLCAEDPPQWKKEKLDFYYWYYASLALFQVGGSKWDRWAAPMMKTLFNSQRGFRTEDAGSNRENLDEYGSWDAVDAWSSAGGRVYSTAINCLTLQVWYRYERLAKNK